RRRSAADPAGRACGRWSTTSSTRSRARSSSSPGPPRSPKASTSWRGSSARSRAASALGGPATAISARRHERTALDLTPDPARRSSHARPATLSESGSVARIRQTARRMALVPCPECGKPMSTQAPSCPQCGYAPPGGPVRFAAVGEAVQDGGRRPEAVIWEGGPSLKLLLVQVLRTLIVATAAIVAALLVHPLAVKFFEDLSAGKGGRGPRDGSPATLILMVIVGSYLVIRAIVLSTSVMRLRTTKYLLTNQPL